LTCRASVLDHEEGVLSVLERYTEDKFKQLVSKKTDKATDISLPVPPSPPPIPPPPPPPPPPAFQTPASFTQAFPIKNPTPNQLTDHNGQQVKSPSFTVVNSTNAAIKLPQQCVPKPLFKMKQLTWSIIPSNRIVGKSNLWTKFESEKQSSVINLDTSEPDSDSVGYYRKIQEFFKTHEEQIEKRDLVKKELRDNRISISMEKINLLDNRRSLNINIYLKQFRCSPFEIVQLIMNNKNHELGLENLEGMLKILPDANELVLLKGYQGDFDKLGEAERFLFVLIQVPNYKLRIESLLLKEEFNNQTRYIINSFDHVSKASDTVYNSKNLASLMLYICKAGNFINDVSIHDFKRGCYTKHVGGFFVFVGQLCEWRSWI
jgi:hypothetical protein